MDAATPPIRWSLRLAARPDEVFAMLATDCGRTRFWAQTAQTGNSIAFAFPNGHRGVETIRESIPGRRFELTYFSGIASFVLEPNRLGGTDLTLTHSGLDPDEWTETYAGWISVLLILKGSVDHGIDLRNGDADATWDQGFVDQ